MSKLKITSTTVTINNGIILYHSILSIINYVDEILIFDDSDIVYDRNEYLYKLANEHKSIKIVKKDFQLDLGKKKQYLCDIAKNNIILRWDDDFILYDPALLKSNYDGLSKKNYDYCYNYFNPNIMYNHNFTNKEHPYCTEIYLYRKNAVKYINNGRFIDFPHVVGKSIKKRINKPLFIHLSNYKSYELKLFRNYMTPYLLNGLPYDFYEYILHRKGIVKCCFNDVINLKIATLEKKQDHIKYDSVKALDPKVLNADRISKLIPDEIQKKFTISKINATSFTFNQPLTFKNINVHLDDSMYSKLISFLFYRLTGFHPQKYNDDPNIFNYIIGTTSKASNNKSVIWGADVLPTDKYFKIHAYKNLQNGRFGDPILLLSSLYTPTIQCTKDAILLDNIDFINTLEPIKLIDLICSHKIITTNILFILVLCHTYNIDCNYLCVTNSCKEYLSTVCDNNLIPNKTKINQRKKDLCDTCPFITSYNKKKLLDSIYKN